MMMMLVAALFALVVVACEEMTTDDGTRSADTQPSFGSRTVPNQSYTQNTAIALVTLPQATGGNAPLTYRLTPAVPGLRFDAGRRRLSGTPTASGEYYMTYTATDADGDSDTLPFTITVDDHGDSISDATHLALGGSRAGRIEPASDVDYFRIETVSSGILVVYTEGILDTVCTLYDVSGSYLEENDDSDAGTNCQLTFSVDPGTYYVHVASFSGESIGDYVVYAGQQSSIPTRAEFASGEPLLAYLRDGAVDPLTQRSVDALRATVPAAEWDEFVSQLEIISVNSTILEFLTNKAFRTVLQVSAPIYDEHFVATSSSSRRQLQQSSEDTDQQTLTQLGEEFATVMAGLLLSGGSLVWGCAAVTPIVCAGAILTGYLLYSLFWDTAEAAGLPPGTSGGHATGLVELADRVAPCDAQGCQIEESAAPDGTPGYTMEALDFGPVDISLSGDSGTLEVCVRDWGCEDGDIVTALIGDPGRELMSNVEILRRWQCEDVPIQAGHHYLIRVNAINGTARKCGIETTAGCGLFCDPNTSNFPDLNSGELRVSAESSTATDRWEAPGGSYNVGWVNVR